VSRTNNVRLLLALGVGILLFRPTAFAQEEKPHQAPLIVVVESQVHSVSAAEIRDKIATLLGVQVVPLSDTKVSPTDSIVCIFITRHRELSLFLHNPETGDQSFSFSPESYGKDNAISIANIVASLIRTSRMPQPSWGDSVKRPELRFNPYFDRWESPRDFEPSTTFPPVNPYYSPGYHRNRT
jgi:hypothetical protein